MDPSDLASLLGYGQTPPGVRPIIDPNAMSPESQAPIDPSQVTAPAGSDMTQPSGGVVSPGQTPAPGLPGVDMSNPQNGGVTSPSGGVALPPGAVNPSLFQTPAPGSAGASKSGFSTTANAKVQATQSGLDKQLAGERTAVANEYAPFQDDFATANTAAKSAIDLQTAAETAKIDAAAVGKRTIADAQALHGNQVEASYAQARSEAESIKADYRSALRDYGAAQVNPAQLWDSAGKEGRAGFMATAFMHDFLGAKGIKTSAMDTFNQAVRNNIDSQLENIRKKKDVAAGFKDLWDMQRAQSATDAEAKERIYGFHIQAMAGQVDADMAKYDSPLAQAKGAAAKAALQQEMVKSELGVQEHIDAAANARTAQRVQVYDAQLKASMEQAKLNYEKNKDKAAKAPSIGDYIVDTSISGGNRFRYQFNTEDKEARRLVNNKVAATSNMISHVRELQDLQDQLGKQVVGSDKYSQILSEQNRKEIAYRGDVVNAIALAQSGLAVSNEEREEIAKNIPKEGWFTNGSNRAVLGGYIKHKIDDTNTLIHQYAHEIGPDDPMYNRTSGTSQPYADVEGQLAANDANHPDDHGVKATPNDVAVQAITRPDATKPASAELKAKLDPEHHNDYQWSRFLDDHPGFSIPVSNGRDFNALQKNSAGHEADPSETPPAFESMQHWADTAKKGGKEGEAALNELVKWAHAADSNSDTDLRRKAGVRVTDPAGNDADGGQSKALQAMALWELSMMQGDLEAEQPADGVTSPSIIRSK